MSQKAAECSTTRLTPLTYIIGPVDKMAESITHCGFNVLMAAGILQWVHLDIWNTYTGAQTNLHSM